MSNLLERSILMTLGAASLTRDMAEAAIGDFINRGQEARGEGREAVNELVGKARDETRAARGRIDASLQRTFRDMGLATGEQLEELELKLAQLEHRISLLEAAAAETAGSGKEKAEK